MAEWCARRTSCLHSTLALLLSVLISLQWVLFGYTIAFGTSIGGIFGGLDYLGFAGVTGEPNPDIAGNIPHLAFAAFQMTFAIITPALITGTFVERIRFKTFLVFTLLLGNTGLRSGCPLGMGWRHPCPDRRSRLCRRHRRAYYGRVLSAGLCHGNPQTPWVWHRLPSSHTM